MTVEGYVMVDSYSSGYIYINLFAQTVIPIILIDDFTVVSQRNSLTGIPK